MRAGAVRRRVPEQTPAPRAAHTDVVGHHVVHLDLVGLIQQDDEVGELRAPEEAPEATGPGVYRKGRDLRGSPRGS